MLPKIIFEDESFAIVAKPPGYIVNDATTTVGRDTIQGWISQNFKFELAQNREYRNGIVHRLDKETSGALLIAKTAKAFGNLQQQFKDRLVKKLYIALTHGKIDPQEGNINVPIARLPWNKERFGPVPGGKEAFSAYKVKRYYKKGKEVFSLVEVYPKTGRTHQIRVHLKHQGYPIVADEFYAGRKTARSDRKWCPRTFLHAHKITFNHPENGKRLTFESPLPSDLEKSLSTLEIMK
jgi:23S rRNA pseudouridine1911/1915/1917 synthase